MPRRRFYRHRRFYRRRRYRRWRKSHQWRGLNRDKSPSDESFTTKSFITGMFKAICILVIIVVVGYFVLLAFTGFESWYKSQFGETVMWEGGYIIGGDGHNITLYNNSSASNPTWDSLLQFLQQDNTDQIPYVEGHFVCADYAERLHNNAEQVGIRAGYVNVFLNPPGGLHSLNAFQTTDRGLVFIDDVGSLGLAGYDKQVNIVVGEQYVPTALFYGDVGFYSIGAIESYKIQW